MAQTAEQILDQAAISNNLGLHLAANGSVRVYVLFAMEYYSEFGGVADDILEQIAQNNDLGLQLSAGWIRIPILAAMETYADQEDDGMSFALSLGGDIGSKLINLSVFNQNDVDFAVSRLWIAGTGTTTTPIFDISASVLMANTPHAFPSASGPATVDGKYFITLDGIVNDGGDLTRYYYTSPDLLIELNATSPTVITAVEVPF